MKANTLPADKSSLTRSFTMIGDRNQEILKEVVGDKSHEKLNVLFFPHLINIQSFTPRQTFYESCMDTAAMDKLGSAPIIPFIELVRAVRLRSSSLLSLFASEDVLHFFSLLF